MSWRDCAALLLIAGLAAFPALRAAEAPVDADLLEFLGSVDSDDAGWNEYLEHADIRKVAKPPLDPNDPNARKAPADQRKPPDQNDEQDRKVDGT